ncbi:hypothetical protein V6N11_023997 [Hibiscus sabdariffa]|uniref:RING-type E3 ubiquitin transferase n=1 Tax=Hibiscus sabdariffa TaxID=183260 RepID=A0ABR2TNW6_9ROSI
MEFKIVAHQSHPLQIMLHHRQIPTGSIQIVLTVNVSYITPIADNPFFSQKTLFLLLGRLQSPRCLHQILSPKLAEMGIDMSSDEYKGVLQDIIKCGFGTVHGMLDQGYYCHALQLHSNMFVEPMAMAMSDLESSMTGALAESGREFEDNNYGMLPANKVSVEKMVKRVIVEDGEKGDCMVCLDELGVGFYASRLPCSHIFHGDCIGKWLDQSHYCPICRFEMPTD